MINKIGIKIVSEEPKNINRVERALEHCAFVGLVREGHRFYAKNEDISCPLARYSLGLDEPNSENVIALSKVLVGWMDAKTEEIGLEYLRSIKTLPFISKYILYFPFPDQEYKPDVVIEISTPNDFMGKVRELTYLTGGSVSGPSSGVGAMCGECTAFPIAMGKPNISVGCTGSRPRVKLQPEEMFLALPCDIMDS